MTRFTKTLEWAAFYFMLFSMFPEALYIRVRKLVEKAVRQVYYP